MNLQMQSSFDMDAPVHERAQAFREALDMPNAILMFEATAPERERLHRPAQDRAIAAGLPAFFSSFMPKSGGTFLHNRLVQLGAVEIFNHVPNPANYLQAYLIESWLRLFLRGGSCCHSHLLPTPYNLSVMQRVGVDRMWIHSRDPRQVALSVYWHQEGHGQGEGPVAEARIAAEKAVRATRKWIAKVQGFSVYEDLSFDDKCKEAFVLYQNWMRDWLAASAAHPEIRFLFTTHEQMVADREAFQDALFSFFGYRHRGPAAFSEVGPLDRFRAGTTDEWRSVYSPELQGWISDRIDRAIYQAVGWPI